VEEASIRRKVVWEPSFLPLEGLYGYQDTGDKFGTSSKYRAFAAIGAVERLWMEVVMKTNLSIVLQNVGICDRGASIDVPTLLREWEGGKIKDFVSQFIPQPPQPPQSSFREKMAAAKAAKKAVAAAEAASDAATAAATAATAASVSVATNNS